MSFVFSTYIPGGPLPSPSFPFAWVRGRVVGVAGGGGLLGPFWGGAASCLRCPAFVPALLCGAGSCRVLVLVGGGGSPPLFPAPPALPPSLALPLSSPLSCPVLFSPPSLSRGRPCNGRPRLREQKTNK